MGSWTRDLQRSLPSSVIVVVYFLLLTTSHFLQKLKGLPNLECLIPLREAKLSERSHFLKRVLSPLLQRCEGCGWQQGGGSDEVGEKPKGRKAVTKV